MNWDSFNLGIIEAFAEMVSIGVKRIAFSAPLAPEDAERLLPEARKITDKHGVGVYLEKEFLVTDLFPAEITEGKHVLVIYSDTARDEYQALKLAPDPRKLGKLLGYPDAWVENRLS